MEVFVHFEEVNSVIPLTFEEANSVIYLTFEEDNSIIDLSFENIHEITDNSKIPKYEGSYAITPKASAQMLLTANKYLEQDVQIKKIPYAEVSNIKGGLTITIGEV